MSRCAACGAIDVASFDLKSDPLRWDLTPPCSQAEWEHLANLPNAPPWMAGQPFKLHMNKICRACWSKRITVKTKLVEKVRGINGGIDAEKMVRPTKRMEEEFDEKKAFLHAPGKPAEIHGLASAVGAALEGQLCRLNKRDPITGRWTVDLLASGERKAIRQENLRVSREVDDRFSEAEKMQQTVDYAMAAVEARTEEAAAAPAGAETAASVMEEASPTPVAMHPPPVTRASNIYSPNPPSASSDGRAGASEMKEVPRPLGSRTPWPKVKGVHPGAVVRLQNLLGATELNGRKARCIKFDPDLGRWEVDLGDERKSISPDHFVPIPGERPPTAESAEAEKADLAARNKTSGPVSAKEKFAQGYGWNG